MAWANQICALLGSNQATSIDSSLPKRILRVAALLCSGYPKSLERLKNAFLDLSLWQDLIQPNLLIDVRRESSSMLLCKLSEIVDQLTCEKSTHVKNDEIKDILDYVLTPPLATGYHLDDKTTRTELVEK